MCDRILTARVCVWIRLLDRLATLNDAAERVSAMTKQTADAYAENAAEFVRAARVAKEIQQDLDSASHRIA